MSLLFPWVEWKNKLVTWAFGIGNVRVIWLIQFQNFLKLNISSLVVLEFPNWTCFYFENAFKIWILRSFRSGIYIYLFLRVCVLILGKFSMCLNSVSFWPLDTLRLFLSIRKREHVRFQHVSNLSLPLETIAGKLWKLNVSTAYPAKERLNFWKYVSNR